MSASGCTFFKHESCFTACDPCQENRLPACGPSYLQIEEPCPGCSEAGHACGSLSPDAVPLGRETRYVHMTLEQAIQEALNHSEVLRDLGASVIRSPGTVRSSFEPAIVHTDPRFGEEAALSDFDATLAASGLWENNDRVLNNTFAGNDGIVVQDLGSYNLELRKRAATGTQMSIRHVTDYDYNNFVGNRFGSPSGSWTTFLDLEVRQPLWQGAGSEFNRIAGPNGVPGAFNGVLLARIRSDVSLAEFEAGVRDLVSNVENAYWDLYFAYFDFEAKKSARDQALALLNLEKGKQEGESKSAEDALQAEEQYWRFESDVQDSLFGRLIDGTRTDNGAAGGAFRSTGGVRVAERRLRLIIGLPITTGELIKPVTEPQSAPISYDWATCTTEALNDRAELRRQRWQIKRRELELLASKNFLSPRLDLIARYRQRGFGRDLASQSHQNGQAVIDGGGNTINQGFQSAFGNLARGENEEWQLGVELEVPLGFRRGHSAVRNAELALSREVALLREQEQQVLYGLSNSVADVERAFTVMTAQYNRLATAGEQVKVLTNRYSLGRTNIDVVLESQRRLADSQIRFRQAQVEYMLALKNVHYEKGTLLAHNGIFLAESGAHRAAADDVLARRQSRRMTIDYVNRDKVVSAGPTGMENLPAGSGNCVIAPSELPIDSSILMEEGTPIPLALPPVQSNTPIEPAAKAGSSLLGSLIN